MTGIIILAAGASTRMGRAKQTLEYQEKTLLEHAVRVAVNSGVSTVIVVVGANEKEIVSHIENEPVSIVINKDFGKGMSTSIKKGLSFLLKHHKDCENVILMVCDQPYVNEGLIKRLIQEKQNTQMPVIACAYENTVGVPALFDKQFFPELLALKADEGGKKILLNNQTKVAAIPFPDGRIDIDTAADYDALIKG